MTPHDLSTPTSPGMDPEEIRMRKMTRRSKVIQELVQTEKDYLTDLELCIREVVQPLRNLQVKAAQHRAPLILTTCLTPLMRGDGFFPLCQVVDVDRLFTNTETVCEVSAVLLHRLHEAIAEPDKEAVVIGSGIHPLSPTPRTLGSKPSTSFSRP